MDFPASTTSSGEPRDGWTRDIPPTGCKPLLQRITSASAKRCIALAGASSFRFPEDNPISKVPAFHQFQRSRNAGTSCDHPLSKRQIAFTARIRRYVSG